jgi:hypothetical protein
VSRINSTVLTFHFHQLKVLVRSAPAARCLNFGQPVLVHEETVVPVSRICILLFLLDGVLPLRIGNMSNIEHKIRINGEVGE